MTAESATDKAMLRSPEGFHKSRNRATILELKRLFAIKPGFTSN
jgi:hypothetical protein